MRICLRCLRRPGQLKVLKARELWATWGMFLRPSRRNSGWGTNGSSKSPGRGNQQLMFDKGTARGTSNGRGVGQEIMESRFFFRMFRDLAISKPCKFAVCY